MLRLLFMKDMFWYKLAAFCARQISDQGRMAIVLCTERERAEEEHKVLH